MLFLFRYKTISVLIVCKYDVISFSIKWKLNMKVNLELGQRDSWERYDSTKGNPHEPKWNG